MESESKSINLAHTRTVLSQSLVPPPGAAHQARVVLVAVVVTADQTVRPRLVPPRA